LIVDSNIELLKETKITYVDYMGKYVEYVTLKETSAKWGISKHHIQNYVKKAG
jgi:hypothetical protein